MTEMSRGAEKENGKDEKGVVKTEVPTKVHWAKGKNGGEGINLLIQFFPLFSLITCLL